MGKIRQKTSILQENSIFSEIPSCLDVSKDIQVTFTAPDLSSDGGLILVAKAERSIGIVRSLGKCVHDWRNPEFISHTIENQLRQRVFQIAAGYEDANDCNSLRNDSILKMCCGRLPSEDALCSQPTMTRLENHVGHGELWDMGKAFVRSFISSYDKPPRKIILDVDDSNANTYGAQQLSLFNGYYGEWCYMPLFVFEGYSGRMVLPILYPGRRTKQANVAGLLIRLVKALRRVWPQTVITLRGDVMFCSHKFMAWADGQRGVRYCVGFGGNCKINHLEAVTKAMAAAEASFKASGKPCRIYGKFLYKAHSWDRRRWVFFKAEHSSMGPNLRFIVYHNGNADPKTIYEKVYCKRGDCELFIKEFKNDIAGDRMSCNKFTANQFRMFLHAAAYVLLWHIRHQMLKGTDAIRWTAHTLQLYIIKSAVHISEKKTRVRIEFGRGHPSRDLIELALGRE